ncbi:hypothetical protein JCGZ_13150 [Jatropha curcas]|uniref:Uncharacterized protein n=1 Tax=Jatropha curcas TaxID=180498 RepID=A0A067KK16_JATCU|nr:hypothetical protein JCGZ_13150 [Jatropha curcas]
MVVSPFFIKCSIYQRGNVRVDERSRLSPTPALEVDRNDEISPENSIARWPAFQSRSFSIPALIARTNTTEEFVSTRGSRWSARMPNSVPGGRRSQ